MYRPTSPQSSFYEPHYLIPDILPKDDWSYIYRDKIFPIIDEEKFKFIYKEKGGAPNKSIKLKISLLIFMSVETLHWREAEFMFRRRIDWMNATHTCFGEAFIDHTTLFKFFTKLEENESAYELFKDITGTFIRECEVSTKVQRTDSFFMHGWLATLSRYGLFKETISAFLKVLRKHQLDIYEKIQEDLSRDYLKDNFDLTEKDKALATRKVNDMAQDLLQLKEAFQNDGKIKGYQSFKTLVKVFEQQCEVREKVNNKDEVNQNNNSLDNSPEQKQTEILDSKNPKVDVAKEEQTNPQKTVQPETDQEDTQKQAKEPNTEVIEHEESETKIEQENIPDTKQAQASETKGQEQTKPDSVEEQSIEEQSIEEQSIEEQSTIKSVVQPNRDQEEKINSKEALAPESIELKESIQCSKKVLEQEIKKDTLLAEIREKPQGDHIISSPHNTDAEYTRKRNQTVVGHKCFATETCDPENDVQFITDVNLKGARHSDAKELAPIQKRLEKNHFKPEVHHNDAGFVNGETILESHERGISLEGPSSGRSQSFEEYNDKDRPLDVADFKVSFDDSKELTVVKCPKGCSPEDQKRSNKTGRIIAHFLVDTCSSCTVAERCPVKIGKRVSSFNIDEKQYAGALRHHQYMGDPEYRKFCGTRAGAESMVNEFVNGHGARQSRHKTEKRSKLQLTFAAIGVNVKRFLRHSQKCVQKTVKTAT